MTSVVVRDTARPRVSGKFIFIGDKKLYVRGVTYGAFRPGEAGHQFPDVAVVEQDFSRMAENGVNAVRTYTVPPRWLLDIAHRHRLHVMIGLPMELLMGELIDNKRPLDVKALVRAQIQGTVGHPSVLGFAVANEIPASLIRWVGPRRVERYIESLCEAVKAEDSQALVTYMNYPTTEYLELPFLDLICFNVYLDSLDSLKKYLAHLHNVIGERPLVLSEIGLDTVRHGEEAQARELDWQVRAAFSASCAGVFVFAWTDEWYAGGVDVQDWGFGLTDRDRHPKPALAAVRGAFTDVPFLPVQPLPRVSVVVCTHNGQRTIRECLEGLRRLEYPNFEVIVVDDGSTDATPTIVRDSGYSLVQTEHRGLSSARNTGWQAASGEIVAYLDDDAYPDPHWLTYLTATFMRTSFAGVGGPNIPPPGDGLIAECVANAPGGPIHVLISDEQAEHIPGCNMSFRKAALDQVGGFDPRFRIAGDDVDVCWRLQQHGMALGFCPGAVVWHHRRNSLRGYWKQQVGYGAAEALLERKWPSKYNAAGQPVWNGRLYGSGVLRGFDTWHRRIYHGSWGSALFQSLYRPAPSIAGSVALMPEWFLIILVLAGISAITALWVPLVVAVSPLAFACSLSLLQAAVGAANARLARAPRDILVRLKLRTLIALLHLLQPLARLWGRFRCGLRLRRQRGISALTFPRVYYRRIWSQERQTAEQRLGRAEARILSTGTRVLRGSDYDRWDLEAQVGLLGSARMVMALEEHDGGTQVVRFRWWPVYSRLALVLMLLFAGLSVAAAIDESRTAAVAFGAIAVLLALGTLWECGTALLTVSYGLEERSVEPA